MRPISSELSILGNCDGSARVKQGNSSVIIGIWGPVEVKQSKEDPEKCVIETTVKSATGQGSPLDKMYEEALRQTCEQIVITSAHPRTCIQVDLRFLIPLIKVLSYPYITVESTRRYLLCLD